MKTVFTCVGLTINMFTYKDQILSVLFTSWVLNRFSIEINQKFNEILDSLMSQADCMHKGREMSHWLTGMMASDHEGSMILREYNPLVTIDMRHNTANISFALQEIKQNPLIIED